MGLLDGLGKQLLGNLCSSAIQNPQLLSALMGILNQRSGNAATQDASGGLGSLVQAFENKGLGNIIGSWISPGANSEISPDQITHVLGQDTVAQFANEAGVPHEEAGGLLAQLLPMVVDKLTPQGQMPESGHNLESSLGGILKGLCS